MSVTAEVIHASMELAGRTKRDIPVPVSRAIQVLIVMQVGVYTCISIERGYVTGPHGVLVIHT